ncbi:uncharacterized protein LAESUDRAFT_760214 [Laetiporus sulphureus 93-53]|uniref:Uncharacterized protein n=1 Tax=Laetiporus sulphureus 93-53 TaxID=1314785 RepID=A0A165DPD2_9APHY|nr:uncharacterized protein LAESUDRAFT_760214 [Laetiporus sulphureus 93-53]KZT05325.1 hypothetical protein LAESUDRAFT_760214 [Laetiporus sulphureus 93-53]
MESDKAPVQSSGLGIALPAVDVTPAELSGNPWVTITPEAYAESHEIGFVGIHDEGSPGPSEHEYSSEDEMRQDIFDESLVNEALVALSDEVPAFDAMLHHERASDRVAPESRAPSIGVSHVSHSELVFQFPNGRSSAFLSIVEGHGHATAPGIILGASVGPPVSTAERPIDDAPLSKLMQAMSLAVATGVREGVQKALDTVGNQGGHKGGRTQFGSRGNAGHGIHDRVDRSSRAATGSGRMDVDEEEYFGDEDEGGDACAILRSQGRKGPRDNNLFNARFRDYLRSRHVLPISGVRPQSATPDAVQAFADGSGDGPDIAAPLIDWNHELSSRWNKEVVFLLSRDFLQRIKSGHESPLVFDEETMSQIAIARSCTMKLQRVRIEIRDAGRLDSDKKKSENAAAFRRNTRRQGIFNRRMGIVKANKASERSLWGAIEEVLELLDIAGMSSDHTDDGITQDFKVVRRARLLWRHDDLEILCHAIDTFHAMSRIPQSRGNRALLRISLLTVSSLKSSRQYVRGLPRSFYDAQWLASLDKSECQQVGYTSAIEIPHLADYVDG